MKTVFRFILTWAALGIGLVRVALAEDARMNPQLVSAYVKIADAFAADDLAAAKTAAAILADHATMARQAQIAEEAGAVANAADISAGRERLKTLSVSIEPLAAGIDGYTLMKCDMANADWVQASGDVKNPYLGKTMLTCGEPKAVDAKRYDHDGHAKDEGHGCGAATTDQNHAQHGCG